MSFCLSARERELLKSRSPVSAVLSRWCEPARNSKRPGGSGALGCTVAFLGSRLSELNLRTLATLYVIIPLSQKTSITTRAEWQREI
jgi:hypothetical protein